MPDAKGFFPDGSLTSDQKDDIAETLKRVTAVQMSCYRPDGTYCEITPNMVTVVLIGVPRENFHSKRDFLLEVMTYDYPDRMNSMPDRLAAIGQAVKQHLPPDADFVSVNFIPQPSNCWVSV